MSRKKCNNTHMQYNDEKWCEVNVHLCDPNTCNSLTVEIGDSNFRAHFPAESANYTPDFFPLIDGFIADWLHTIENSYISI